MNAYVNIYIQTMDTLLQKINKLQDVFTSTNMQREIDLPQIVVVGTQSSGKSSVIEHIVGKDFLPRGSGIVTRRPLVLQLVNSNEKNQDGFLEYGAFLHSKKIYNNFEEIKKEISDETDRETKGKNISSKPINLKIHSPNVPNLTLVDLPGLTQIAIEGQDKKIVENIRKMVTEYIIKENSLILAIISANIDIANSDALKIAKEVDPESKRTIGVLTKVDLVDKGSSCIDTLNGKLYKLDKGYVGVVLRSQYDIDNKKTIIDAIKDEKKYFEKHETYGKFADRMGTEFLSKKLSSILTEHIKICLPDIKNKIANRIKIAEERLLKLGFSNEIKLQDNTILLNIINNFISNYKDIIDGNSIGESNYTELFGGARINFIINKKYMPNLLNTNVNEDITENDIKMAIKNSKGIKSTLFISESAFIMLAKIQIKKLLIPSIKCVDEIFNELVVIIDILCKDILAYNILKNKIKDILLNNFKNYMSDLKKFISDLIDIETSYIDTEHPDFLNKEKIHKLLEKLSGKDEATVIKEVNKEVSKEIKKDIVKKVEPVKYDKEKIECEIVEQLLNSYMSIVKKNVYSNVTKSIMCFLVNKSKNEIQSILIKNLYKEELICELLKRDSEVINQINKMNNIIVVHKKSQEIINEITDN